LREIKMIWIDNLKNTTNFELNDTVINNTDNLVPNMITNANTITNNLWFHWVIWSMFLVFMILFMRKDEQELNYDIPRAIMISSAICLILSIIAVVTPYINTFLPVIWFGVLFLLSLFASLERKKKNL